MATSLTFDILARDRASATFGKVGKSVDKTSRGLERFRTVAVGAGLAVGAALLKFGKDSAKAFVEAEDAQTRLQDAFERFPKIADSNIDSIDKIASALQKKTKADDEAVKSGAAVLAQFVDSGRQLEQLLPLLVDFAQKTGRDVPTAATTLGKAFLGNTRALKELGIAYKMTGDRATDVANITELVRQKVGGFAEKEGKTAAGQAAILSNQFEELQETVGSKLVPALLKLVKAGIATAGFIQRNKEVMMPLLATIGALIVATKAYTAAQLLLNIALDANPVGVVIVSLAALTAVLVVGRQRSEKFRESVDGAFKQIGLSALSMADFTIKAMRAWLNVSLNVFNLFLQGAAKAFGWLPDVGDDIRKAAKDFSAFKDSTIHSLDAAGREVDRLQRKLHALRTRTVHVNVVVTASGAVSALSPRGRALIESRQHGGPLLPGRSYLFEGHPEIISMGSSQRGFATPVGRGSGTVVNVNVMVAPNADKAAVGRATVDAIEDYLKKGGKLPPRMRAAS